MKAIDLHAEWRVREAPSGGPDRVAVCGASGILLVCESDFGKHIVRTHNSWVRLKALVGEL